MTTGGELCSTFIHLNLVVYNVKVYIQAPIILNRDPKVKSLA